MAAFSVPDFLLAWFGGASATRSFQGMGVGRDHRRSTLSYGGTLIRLIFCLFARFVPFRNEHHMFLWVNTGI